MEDNKKKLEELRIEYDLFKYNLPSFQSLLDDFDLLKVCEKDSGYLLRDIRRTIVEKLNGYLQLFEFFLNPISPPLFIISLVRYFNNEDKKLIKQMYNEISKLNLLSLKLDTIYNEEKEAEFIKNSYEKWSFLKKQIYDLLDKINFENEKSNLDNNSNYFG
ncbi:MAG: hypothetical protein PHX15_01515 [Candidatus Nanoarchaeia archaeon]|jgi:hypothetical protein|nr:hypothetical protein [Candidatus Nanoarchaeia archaeon]MDD3993853.1 hypothetical protein [Candidatus Nanoarchaeia archaeon]MDD4563635.1 hypothetical protein [Candidatus Nanoarchaeia archaeon]